MGTERYQQDGGWDGGGDAQDVDHLVRRQFRRALRPARLGQVACVQAAADKVAGVHAENKTNPRFRFPPALENPASWNPAWARRPWNWGGYSPILGLLCRF